MHHCQYVQYMCGGRGVCVVKLKGAYSMWFGVGVVNDIAL